MRVWQGADDLFGMGKVVLVCRQECVGVCGEVWIVCVVCTCCVVGLVVSDYWLLWVGMYMAA